MTAAGLSLRILAGPTVPVPLPGVLAGRLRSATVTESDEERSAFSLVFDAGRGGPLTGIEVPGLVSPLVPFARVVLVVTLGTYPQVLFDGVVVETSFDPGNRSSPATFTVTGDDLGNLLDREERDVEHPGMDDYPQVLSILARYAQHGLVPLAFPPPTADPPLPIDRIPTQQGTDLEHLVRLAARHGYVAYAMPAPAVAVSTFYWGPPVRVGVPQPALSVDMGPDSNVAELSIRTDSQSPTQVSGSVQDRRTGTALPVAAPLSRRVPLSALPFATQNLANIRRSRLRGASPSIASALGRAQAEADRGNDAVTAEAVVDGARYGSILRARGLVGLRGAGLAQDGLWYVRRVEHELAPGSYTQKVTLAREGSGSTVPVLPRAAS